MIWRSEELADEGREVAGHGDRQTTGGQMEDRLGGNYTGWKSAVDVRGSDVQGHDRGRSGLREGGDAAVGRAAVETGRKLESDGDGGHPGEDSEDPCRFYER